MAEEFGKSPGGEALTVQYESTKEVHLFTREKGYVRSVIHILQHLPSLQLRKPHLRDNSLMLSSQRHYLFRRQQRLTVLKAAVHATVHTVQAFVESQKPFYSKAYRNLLQGVKSLLKIFTNPFSSFCPRLTQYDARNPRKRPSSSVRQYVTTYLRHPHPHCHLFNGYYSPVGGCDRHRNSGGGCLPLGEFLKHRNAIDISISGLGTLSDTVGDPNRPPACAPLNEKGVVGSNATRRG